MREETVNVLTCGVGVLLSVAGLVVLVTSAALHGNAWQVVSFSIYGASLIALFTASTLYHAVQAQRIKRLFEIIDQSAIYLLIAGTYTPFTLVTLRSALGWSMFGVIWGLAVAGIAVTWLFSAEKLRVFSSLSYLVMGWFIVIGARPLLEKLPMAGILWLVAGGVLYSIGVPLFFFKKTPFAHTVWHLFVLGGSICHYVTVRFYVAPM
ncbi:MAG: hemolysin III family protein [Candidatus Omnitrophica bacterium]|nr:hemolysin III family protein [Candidatus Omnitrophota bacterium]